LLDTTTIFCIRILPLLCKGGYINLFLLSAYFILLHCEENDSISLHHYNTLTNFLIMADRYIPEHRRTQFKAKNTFKPEELRRRREEQQVEIRKAKREENLAKRRGIAGDGNRPGASLGAEPDSDDDTAPTESQVCRSSHYKSRVPLATCDKWSWGYTNRLPYVVSPFVYFVVG